MRVLIVSDVLGPENNGTTIAAMNLIRYLKAQGEEVRILCADQDKKGITGYYVVPNINLGFIINAAIKRNNVTLAKPDKKIILKALEGVDIVHGMFPFALTKNTIRIARSLGIPATMGFHCQAENFSSHLFAMNFKLFNNLVYKSFYKNTYKYVNAIHYPTEFIQNTFENVIKRKTNGYVISNGVNSLYKKMDVIREGILKDKYNILFIGRFSKEKSHSLLVKAVSLSKYKNKIQLVFAGQGPTKNKIVKLSKKLKINEPYIGFYDRQKLIEIINCCDLYVHPAEIEIEAIACLEAISCGLVPVISDSKRSATNKFAYGEKNLFKYNSPSDLANRIDYWIEHEEEKKELSNKYLDFAKNYEFEHSMQQMHKMLKTYAKKENHVAKQINYYKDELNDDFANNGIKPIKTPSNFKYIHKNPIYLFFEFILYQGIVKNIIGLLNKIKYNQKIVNHLTTKANKLGGYFVYANHTADMGDAFTPNLIRRRRNSIIVGPETISIKGIKTIVTMLGAFPLPSTFEGMKNFKNGLETRIKRGESITIYPEAHIWPYYTGIRNFKETSFKYPYDLHVPCLCITNTYVKKGKKVRMISHIDGPYYFDYSLPKDEAITKMRNTIYENMKKRSTEVDQYEVIKYINLNDIVE